MKLTLIGNGIMAEAIARGLKEKYEIEVIGRSESKLLKLKERIPEINIITMKDVEDITDKNIIFCVKPYALENVSVRLEGTANTIFSILAGTKLDVLKKQISAKHYVRTMPNIAASFGKSMTTLTGDKEVKNEALEIFSAIGRVLWLDTEKQLDIATAIAGSGPAFLALVAEAISDGGVSAGLERSHCNELTRGLFDGFTSLLDNNHPAIIKDSVMSPGGTTSAGVKALEEEKVRSAFIKAINKAYEKALEISEK